MVSLAELNAATSEAFVGHLGVFEHSPWVAERAYDRRPFATREALHAAMVAAVEEAGPERQLALLRAHPELAGQAAARGEMTAFSTRGQGGSGLLDCSPEELAWLQELNRAYTPRGSGQRRRSWAWRRGPKRRGGSPSARPRLGRTLRAGARGGRRRRDVRVRPRCGPAERLRPRGRHRRHRGQDAVRRRRQHQPAQDRGRLTMARRTGRTR
jgi:hypothetical protein